MKYTYFEIKNFKGIRHTRLDLASSGNQAVNTLVGLNESGKTTILEAIDLWLPSDPERTEISPKQLSGWEPPDPQEFVPIAERTNFNGRVDITCGIELDAEDVRNIRTAFNTENEFRLVNLTDSFQIRNSYRFESSRFKEENTYWYNLTAGGYTKSGTKLRNITFQDHREHWLWLVRYIRPRLPTIWLFPNFLFELPARIYLQPREGETPADMFYRALVQDILDSLERGVTVEEHVVDRALSEAPSDEKNLEQLLLDASTSVTNAVVSQWDEIFSDRPLTGKSVRIHHGVEGRGDERRVYLEFRIEDSGAIFSLRERSLGFRWFFVYLLLTSYRGRRRAGSNRMLFLFDEPASNLHPTAQSALLSSLKELSQQATVIYTTHSHHLINPEWLSSAYVVRNRGLDDPGISTNYTARQTDVVVDRYRNFAAQHPDQSHFFQPILAVLDYAPSRLELVPDIVMVEGKTDFFVLTYFQRTLAMPKSRRVNLLPGGGAGSLGDLIRLYLGWGRSFLVLLDGDKTGEREKGRYLDTFGEIIRGRILTLNDLIPQQPLKGIEGVLSDSDKIAFQRIVEPGAVTYSKKALSRGVQEAVAGGIEVATSQASRQTAREILVGLRDRLRALS